MENLFIKAIQINEMLNIKDFYIPLGDNKKNNLIITGKNGSGKTTLLRELKKFLNLIILVQRDRYDAFVSSCNKLIQQKNLLSLDENKEEIQKLNDQIRILAKRYLPGYGTIIEFNQPLLVTKSSRNGDYIIAFFDAKRATPFNIPKGINKINIKPIYQIDDHAGTDFIQYIVNLKADRSFAKDDNDSMTVSKIDKWFVDFEKNLFMLFDTNNIRLEFDRKNYNFNIIEDSKEPYNLNQLSDGYSAILSVVTELMMRMENHKTKSYDVQGIVLIDEIETHLHIELQKKILPFLTSFFPRIQFIVTTHSPFVLSSIENTIICDLENKIVTSDLSGYSYDTLIESYFSSDKYSNELKIKIEEYEKLKEKTDLSNSDKDKLLQLKNFLNEIPKFLSDELAVKLQQIRLKDLKKKDNDL
jgi:AAA15 family ATPase/GTPase